MPHTQGPRKRVALARSAFVLALWVSAAAALAPLELSSQLRYERSAFRSGESLRYKVKWSLFRLGTVSVRQEFADPLFPAFQQVYLDGESADGLPFVDVLFRSTSLLAVDSPSVILYELASGRENPTRTYYVADPTEGRLFGLETKEGENTRLDTLLPAGPVYDGIGLLMYARCAAGSDTTMRLLTVMDYKLGMTTIRFVPDTVRMKVAAFDSPVSAFLFDGSTDWQGSSFAGMTGAFRGWVSADERRLVLRAEVKIFLGSAVLELEQAGSR